MTDTEIFVPPVPIFKILLDNPVILPDIACVDSFLLIMLDEPYPPKLSANPSVLYVLTELSVENVPVVLCNLYNEVSTLAGVFLLSVKDTDALSFGMPLFKLSFHVASYVHSVI